MSNNKDTGVYQLDNGYWAYRFKINIDGTLKEKRRRTDEFGNPFKTKTSAIKARQQAIINEKVAMRKRHLLWMEFFVMCLVRNLVAEQITIRPRVKIAFVTFF